MSYSVKYAFFGLNINAADSFEAVVIDGVAVDDDPSDNPMLSGLSSYTYVLGGSDLIDASGYDDFVYAGDGGDIVYGNSGQDELYGVAGDDRLFGGTENDILRGGGGDDELFGDEGRDSIFGESGGDQIGGGEGNDTISGGGGDDQASGGDGNDRMLGNAGDDYLSGEGARDYLEGGNGSDTLWGGASGDRLIGGVGDDVFIYFDEEDSRNNLPDTIYDFQHGSDKIDLRVMDADRTTMRENDFKFAVGDFTGYGQVRVVARGGDVQIELNTGGTLAADMKITVLNDGVEDWNADDFFL